MHLNLIQVAESLGVGESVVMAWVRHEGLPCVMDGGRLFFDRTEVAGWAAERGMAARTSFLAPSPASGRAGAAITLAAMLRRGGIWRNVGSADVLPTFANIVSRLEGVSSEIRRMLAQRVQSPSAITWAPVGGGFALPHIRSGVALGRESGFVALLLLSAALPLMEEAPDSVPVNRLFFFMASTPRSHLETLAGLSALLSRGSFGEHVRHGAPDSVILMSMDQFCSKKSCEAEQ